MCAFQLGDKEDAAVAAVDDKNIPIKLEFSTMNAPSDVSDIAPVIIAEEAPAGDIKFNIRQKPKRSHNKSLKCKRCKTKHLDLTALKKHICAVRTPRRP